MRLLKDRWKLSPIGASIFVFALNALQAFIDLVLLRISHQLYFSFETPNTRTFYFTSYIAAPVGAYFVMRFYRHAESVFERIYSEGVVRVSLPDYNSFLEKLDRRFNSILLHLVVLLLAAAPVVVYIATDAAGEYTWRGFQTAARIISDGFFVAFPRYFLLLFVAKAVIAAVAVRRVFRWPVQVHLMHADAVGGMSPVANLCGTLARFCVAAALTNAIISMMHGGFQLGSGSVFGLLLALLPLVFLWVLHGAHRAMQQTRREFLEQIDAQARPLIDEVYGALQRQRVTAGPADELLRLDQLRALVARMPTWPFNQQTAIQLGVSVLIPLTLILLQIVLERTFR